MLSSDSRRLRYTRLLLLLGLMLAPGLASGATWVFSLADGSPSVPGTVAADDFIICGIMNGTLGTVGLDDIDAVVFSGYELPLSFSVDSGSLGLPGTDVAIEAGAGDAAGNVYVVNSFGGNRVDYRIVNNGGQVGDDVNAYDVHFGFGLPELFSLQPGNSFGFSGADLLAPGAVPTLGIAAVDLGLLALDDIDAVHRVGSDYFFSLAPGSPSLVSSGYSAADVLVSAVDGSFARHLLAADLGLRDTDNLNALSTWVPEPGVALLLPAGLVWLLAPRRARARRAAR